MPAPDIRLSSEFDCDLHINILYGVIFYAAFYPPRFRIVFCKGSKLLTKLYVLVFWFALFNYFCHLY